MNHDSLWTMPAVVNLQVRNQAMRADSAKLLARVARETGGDVKAERKARSVLFAPDPMDVRGIPAVGRNCPGAIRFTRPEDCIR